MTYAAWRQLTDHAEARLETLRHFAQQVFDDADSARRWLGSSNVAVGRGETPVAACATVPGFLEAMAELARIEAFQRRETAKRLASAAALGERPCRAHGYAAGAARSSSA